MRLLDSPAAPTLQTKVLLGEGGGKSLETPSEIDPSASFAYLTEFSLMKVAAPGNIERCERLRRVG